MGAAEVETFLTHLAVEGMVAVSARNQALGAAVLVSRRIRQGFAARAQRPKRLPTVLRRDEALEVLPPSSRRSDDESGATSILAGRRS